MRLSACIAVSLGVLLLACERAPTEARRNENTKPRVVVVGDGVEPVKKDPTKRPYPLNNAQGRAMWNGARAAFDSSPRVQEVRTLFRLDGVDDLGNADEAAAAAKQIADDPSTIAVIGHATSATTRAAAHIYASSGIPLLMPIATSPNAVYPPGESGNSRNRLRNCFRLPPADVPTQSAAAAIVSAVRLGAKKQYLIRDVAPDAGEYSGPLYNDLLRLFTTGLVGREEVNAQRDDLRAVALRIRAQQPDVVVFCGYGTNANGLLAALRFVYGNTAPQLRPKLVLTDGSKVDDLQTTDLPVYITFPVPPPDQVICASPDVAIIRKLLADRNASYEVYGYDAVLLVSAAVAECKTRLSRRCVAEQLSALKSFVGGSCLAYSFNQGENILSSYYIYSNVHVTNGKTEYRSKVTYADEISAEEITRFDATRSR